MMAVRWPHPLERENRAANAIVDLSFDRGTDQKVTPCPAFLVLIEGGNRTIGAILHRCSRAPQASTGTFKFGWLAGSQKRLK